MNRLCILTFLICSLLCAGCLSPTYVRPPLTDTVPAEFKEDKGWHTARPADTLDRGNWWERFGDAELNKLMHKALAANQNIALAAANFRQARTQVAAARSAFMPSIDLSGAARRMAGEASPTGLYQVGLGASWELTFWNAIPAFEAVRAYTEASAADYATMRLAVQTELAQTYFQLRTLDSQLALYGSTITAFRRAVELTQSQLRGGMITASDVALAEAQLAAAEAEAAALARQRAELEHTIAILTGQIPSNFSLPKQELSASLPEIPPALPATLLERRPDVAAAERRVMVANEEIGIARAAWLPSISLGGSTGYESTAWHSAPLSVWALGPSLAMSVFQGGRLLAQSEAAQAGYEASVAQYRQIVLQAFKDVEDALSALNLLKTEQAARARAVKASQTALELSLSQYRAGLITYLQVVNTQTAALTNQRSALQVKGQRLVTTVNLVKALGGGFNDREPADMRKGVTIPQEGIMP